MASPENSGGRHAAVCRDMDWTRVIADHEFRSRDEGYQLTDRRMADPVVYRQVDALNECTSQRLLVGRAHEHGSPARRSVDSAGNLDESVVWPRLSGQPRAEGQDVIG